jgi:hypothetical protein
MWHVWGIRKMRVGFLWKNQKERDNFEVLGVYGRIMLKWIVK